MILVQTFLITFDEMNVSALNEPQNISLATGKENRKPNSRKRKRAVTSEVESMKTKLLTQVYRSFKRGSETPEQNIRPPLVGLLVDWNVFLSSSSRRDTIFPKDSGLLEISMPKSLNVSMSHQARLEGLWSCFRMSN